MILKPKTTTLNTRALLYKRFIGLAKSETLGSVYITLSNGALWTFDSEGLQFCSLGESFVPQEAQRIAVYDMTTVLQYKDKYFRFNGQKWETLDNLEGGDITLLSAKFNNIGKYQTNKYFYAGSFDYTIRSSIDSTTGQFIKGNITPMSSLQIKHFNDDINLKEDDLVVVDGKLYSVEAPETVEKHQPRRFNIYFATLNSIL